MRAMRALFLLYACALSCVSCVLGLDSEEEKPLMRTDQNGACSSNPLNLPYGKTNIHMARPEGDREFNVYVPQSYVNATGPVPLIFFFNGWLNACDDLPCSGDSSCWWFSEAEARGFVFVYPCGWGDSWNSGTCCAPANTLGIDDVGFVREIVQYIQNRSCIDSSRIFTTGFSDGAMLSEILACQAWDIFSAAASIAGVVEYQPGGTTGLQKCDVAYNASAKNVSILALHGTTDIVVPWYGDGLLGYPCVDENTFLDQPCDIHEWLQRNDCVHSSNTTWKQGDFENKRFAECSGGAIVELIIYTNGGHEYPITSDFNSTEYIVKWLLDTPKP